MKKNISTAVMNTATAVEGTTAQPQRTTRAQPPAINGHSLAPALSDKVLPLERFERQLTDGIESVPAVGVLRSVRGRLSAP